MIFHWNLNDSKSSQFIRNLLSILADVNNSVVWKFSILSWISNPSGLSSKPFATVLRAPIGISVTVMLSVCFIFQARSKFISLFSLFLLYGRPERQIPQDDKVSFYFFSFSLSISPRSDPQAGIRGSVYIRENFISHFPDWFWYGHIPLSNMIKF